MKQLLALSLFLITATCLAQKQNVYYLKFDGSSVSKKDKADFVRVVQEPDPGSTLYNVYEYYSGGNKKLIGKSSSVSPIVFEGQVATFFPNGKKQQLANYHNNLLTGLFYEYFPNGKIFSVRQFPSKPSGNLGDDYLIISCLDSTGKELVKDGEGHYVGYYTGNGSFAEEGDVKNGTREGDWKGTVAPLEIKFTEHYENGKLISGTSIDKKGEKHTYTQRHTRPFYSEGNKALGKFLINQVNFLGRDNIMNVNGTAIISFVMDANRKMEDIQISNSTSEEVNNYLVQATAMSAKRWVPASSFGIPKKASFSFPFSVKTEDSPAFY